MSSVRVALVTLTTCALLITSTPRGAHAALTLAPCSPLASAGPPEPAPGDTRLQITVRLPSGNPAPMRCIGVGPVVVIFLDQTDDAGYAEVDVPDISTKYSIRVFEKRSDGSVREVGGTTVQGPFGARYFTVPPITITPSIPEEGPPPPISGTPSQVVYLPNITKTLGGADGWYTPFIVQNVGAANTDLEVNFYRFSDGALVTRRIVSALKPGTSFADIPNQDADLPHDAQFSVVVRSFGASVVAVVNEHQGSGARAEAGSYVGAAAGALKVSLPNVTKRFFGWNTPFIIQNLGSSPTLASARFVSFDGTKIAVITRSIDPGRSKFIDPEYEAALAGGTQYAVTVTADQPISVVENLHNDAVGAAAPVMYSLNGFATGAASVYGPYAVKNVPGVGKGISTIVVQNADPAKTVTPTLSFTPLGGGSPTTFAGPALAPGASWAWDPRYVDGEAGPGKPLCASGSSNGCLADGEYSFVSTNMEGGLLAAVVNVTGATTAAGYNAIVAPTTKAYLPNVTRRLGGADGWTTPIVAQSVTATSVTLSWYRFSDGSFVTSSTLTPTAGTSQRVDPRDVAGLSDDTQYAVVAQGNGNVAAIVTELNFQGGDGAMTYEGFAQ